MPAENIYRIKQGDTLIDLFGQNWQEVAASNGIEDPTKLQIGQEIDLNLYDYSIVPQGQEQQQVQQEQPSGEDAFKFDAADWASRYFEEGDTGDVYADLSSNVGSIGNDVFSSFSDNSFMPEEEAETAPVDTPVVREAEAAPVGAATTEQPVSVDAPVDAAYERVKSGTFWDGGTEAGQAALGVPVDGVIGDGTREAFAKLYTTDNLASILTAEGGDDMVEGVEYRGAEINARLNPDLVQTTRYGVVTPHSHKVLENGMEVTKHVAGFAKLRNETDKDHALRYYRARVLPKIKVVNGIEQESSQVMDAIAKYIWNKGSLPRSFSLDDEVASQDGMLDITTTGGGKQMNGMVNRTLKEYDAIAEAKGWARVTKIRTVRDPNNSNKFKVQYHNAQGLVHDDGEYKVRHPGSHDLYVADREFDVNSDNDIIATSGRAIPNP